MRYQTCRSISVQKRCQKLPTSLVTGSVFLFDSNGFCVVYTHFRHSTRSSSVGPIFIFLQVITKVIPHSDPLRAPDEEMLGSQSRNGGDRGGQSSYIYVVPWRCLLRKGMSIGKGCSKSLHASGGCSSNFLLWIL